MTEPTTDTIFGIMKVMGLGIATGGFIMLTVFFLAFETFGLAFANAAFASVLVTGGLAVAAPCMALTIAVYREQPCLEVDSA